MAGPEPPSDVEIPAASPLFAGHFPGRPVLPGIAHLALAARALGGSADAGLAAVRSLKLRKPVAPGDRLEIRRGEAGRFELRRGGEVVSQGSIELWQGLEGAGDPGPAEVPDAGFPAPASLLPHAPPALLLRAIVEVSEGAVAAVAEVPPDHPLVRDGRFPAFLALEAAAQAAGALEALGRRGEGSGPRIGYLVGIRDARFAAPWLPAGRPFRVTARLEGGAPPLAVYSAGAAGVAGTLSTFLVDEQGRNTD